LIVGQKHHGWNVQDGHIQTLRHLTEKVLNSE
jgi:hypothetical protein